MLKQLIRLCAVASLAFSLTLYAQQPPNVADLAALTNLVNATAGTNSMMARVAPPGLARFNNDIGIVAAGSGLVLTNLPFIVTLGITNFPLEVVESNTTPRTRVYLDATGGVFQTLEVPAGHTSNGWSTAVYGSPGPWLTPSELSAWYAERDPSRQHITLSLIASNDMPAYLSALTNDAGSYYDGSTNTPVLVYFSNDTLVVKTLASESARTLYLHAPAEVTGFSVYVSTDLTLPTLSVWSLLARLPHNNDPLAYNHLTSASNIFYALGKAQDTDGDGLSDSDEILLHGTDYTNADTDGDGLNDRAEVLQYATDPFLADMDGDWFSDSFEVAGGFNPKAAGNAPGFGFRVNEGKFFVNSTNLTLRFDGLVADSVLVSEGVVYAPVLTNAFAASIAYSLNSPTNGTRPVFARLVRGGVTSRTMVASCALDTVPPSVVVTNLASNLVTDARWVWVRGVVTDNVSAASVRINGAWADGVEDGAFRAGHVMLAEGTNVITVTAEDAAGNGTTQTVSVVQNSSGDATAPVLTLNLPSDRTITGGVTNVLATTTLPSNATLHVQATVDDETALVSASSSTTGQASRAGTVVQTSTQVWMQVALEPGTNLLRLMAVDAAGNTGVIERTVVRDTALVFEITNPAPFQVVNSTGSVVSGKADLRFTNATIRVNGIACSVSNTGTHVEFKTLTSVPLTGPFTALQGEAVTGDGRVYFCDPTVAHYEILEWSYEDRWTRIERGDECGCFWKYDGLTIWHDEWTADSGLYYWSDYDDWLSRSCANTNSGFGFDDDFFAESDAPTDQTYGQFIEDRVDVGASCSAYHFHLTDDYKGSLTFRKVAETQETQLVVFQFLNLDYGRTPGTPIVPSNITYRGQTGFWYGSNVSFIVPIELNKHYTISEADFTWPGYQYSTVNAAGSGYQLSGHWLTFDGFTNDVISVKLDVGNGAGGPPDGDADDPEDGFENYIPGIRGTNPIISLTNSSVTPQLVKLIVRAPKADNVVAKLSNISTNQGFTTDTLIPPSTRDDVSFDADDNTREILIGTRTADGDFIFDTYVGDYGASCRMSFEINGTFGAPPGPNAVITNLVVDTDADGMADGWEREKMIEWNAQYATNKPTTPNQINPADDKESNDPDGAGPLGPHSWTNDAGRGDGWTAMEEYRGCWFNSAAGFGADSGFVRLSPARKELMVEVDRMAGTSSVAIVSGTEIGSAMSLSKTAFLDTAGVRVLYLMDELETENAHLTNVSLRTAYAQIHYASTQTNLFWHDKHIWLLFAGVGDASGRTKADYFGSVVFSGSIRAAMENATAHRRFSEIHDFTFLDDLASVTTHELGHAAGCEGDYVALKANSGLRIRRKSDDLSDPINASWWTKDEGPSRYVVIATNTFRPIEWQFDCLADPLPTAGELVSTFTNASSGFEAVLDNMSPSDAAWLLSHYDQSPGIASRAAGSSSSTWTLIKRQSEGCGVMSYNNFEHNYKQPEFINDPGSSAYSSEIGSMAVRLNMSRQP